MLCTGTVVCMNRFFSEPLWRLWLLIRILIQIKKNHNKNGRYGKGTNRYRLFIIKMLTVTFNIFHHRAEKFFKLDHECKD